MYECLDSLLRKLFKKESLCKEKLVKVHVYEHFDEGKTFYIVKVCELFLRETAISS